MLIAEFNETLNNNDAAGDETDLDPEQIVGANFHLLVSTVFRIVELVQLGRVKNKHISVHKSNQRY